MTMGEKKKIKNEKIKKYEPSTIYKASSNSDMILSHSVLICITIKKREHQTNNL